MGVSVWRAVSVQGGCLCLGGSLSGTPPYGKERSVCILLECILVILNISPLKKVFSKWKKHMGKKVLFFFDVRFSVVKHGNYYSGAFYILVAKMRYAFVNEFANTNSIPLGSATISIELTAGQVVRIENDWSTRIYGTDSAGFIYSWFTGHLLYAL